MKYPQISVILPVYNAGTYLPQCIDSILRQNYRDFELVIVNDGSTDGSEKICGRYAAQDSRIKFITQLNGGVSKARNAGMDAANGKYLTFVDADDWVDPDYLSILAGNMKEGDLSVCDWRDYVEQRATETIAQTISREQMMLLTLDLDSLKYKGVVCKLFDMKIVAEHRLRFAEDIAFGEDTLFFFQYCAASCGNVVLTNQTPYYCRFNSGSCCGSRFKKHATFRGRRDLSGREAYLRCREYTVSKEVLELCDLRITKYTAEALRMKEINGNMGATPFSTCQELRRYLRKHAARYIFSPHTAKERKLSIFLCMLSPKLEWIVWRCWQEAKKYASGNHDAVG